MDRPELRHDMSGAAMRSRTMGMQLHSNVAFPQWEGYPLFGKMGETDPSGTGIHTKPEKRALARRRTVTGR